ncbi:MAG: ATP-binding protein [Lachnospiraceae bacterium]|nr:ATP-binding protein [Lachnospiraceae bacterium]
MRRTVLMLGIAAALLIGLEGVAAGRRGQLLVYAVIVVLQIVILQVTAILISEFRDWKALFTGLASSNVVLPGVLVGSYLYCLSGVALAALAVECLVHLGVLALLVRGLRREYLEIQTIGRNNWMLMCLMPSLLYLFAQSITFQESTEVCMVYEVLAITCFLLIVYTCYYLVFRTLSKLYHDQQELREHEILKAGIRTLRLEEKEVREAETQILSHLQKRRHLILIMQAMMKEHNYEGVKQVLGQMEGMTEVHQMKRYCDNAPINGVVVYYAGEAEEKGISFSAQLDLPESLRVNDWELAVVLGNLLDNALIACEKLAGSSEQSVRIFARWIRNQVLIEVYNSYDGVLTFDEESGLPVSSRGAGHGIGLLSVAHFAEKNQITFDCGLEEGEFVARILI